MWGIIISELTKPLPSFHQGQILPLRIIFTHVGNNHLRAHQTSTMPGVWTALVASARAHHLVLFHIFSFFSISSLSDQLTGRGVLQASYLYMYHHTSLYISTQRAHREIYHSLASYHFVLMKTNEPNIEVRGLSPSTAHGPKDIQSSIATYLNASQFAEEKLMLLN